MTKPIALSLGGLALLALAILTIRDPTVAVQGWFCAFVLISVIPLGSFALLLIHGVTGGRWGRDLAPALIPAARTMPWLLLAFAPVLIFRSSVYHWDALHLSGDVRRGYLNPVFFDARTIAAFVVWSALIYLKVWRRMLTAALGSLAHLVLLSFIPPDWVLTLAPGSTSAAFGFGFGIEQIFAAFAFAAVLSAQGTTPRANCDLSGLIISSLLATLYFIYMQFIVTWYGNIPDKVHWYAVRTEPAWTYVALAALLFGALLPFLAMLNADVRRTATSLRIVGASVLIGIMLHVLWLTVPAFGMPALGGMAAGTTLLTATFFVTARQRSAEARHA